MDTVNYLGEFYHEVPPIELFSFEEYNWVKSPLFYVIESLIISLGGRFFIFQLIHAFFINFLIFRYIAKHSSYIFTSLFFYAILAYTYYNMEIMRGSMSIVICLFANDYILEKKWLKGYLLYILAFLFHPQTIFIFVLSLLFPYLKLNKIGFIAFFLFFVIGIGARNILGDFVFFLEGDQDISSKFSSYLANDNYSSTDGRNILFFIASLIPVCYALIVIVYLKRIKPYPILLNYESMLILYICFMMCRMNFYIAYRFVDYFTIYLCLYFAEYFCNIIKNSVKLTKFMAYTRSLVLFIPLMVLSAMPFFISSGQGYRYYPYNSVLQMNDESKRQHKLNEVWTTQYYYVNINEY